MGSSQLVGYSVRNIIRTLGRKWGSAFSRIILRVMTEFGAVVSYRGVRLSVDTSESLGRSIFYFDDYESAHESAFLELASNRVVFDIGANVGVFTTLAALNGAKVFAFEPSKSNSGNT